MGRINPEKRKQETLNVFLEWEQLEPSIGFRTPDRLRRAWLAGYKAAEREQNRKYKIIAAKLGIPQ